MPPGSLSVDKTGPRASVSGPVAVYIRSRRCPASPTLEQIGTLRDTERPLPSLSPTARPPAQPGSIRRQFLRHSVVTLTALIALLVIGVAGYRLLEDASFVDALYMTVISITTVGFGEIPRPFSPAGRLFTIAMIIGGVTVAAYALGSAAQYVQSGEWQANIAERRRKYMLENLRNHIIVCGYGRVGKGVVHELTAENVPFVVIEVDAATVQRVLETGQLALHGNAADERLLKAAGIDRARGMVVCADSDAENVYIVLTARGLRADLSIVARASYDESESKLMRAGADRVIQPFSIAGRRMVTMLMRPDVADFIDVVSSASGLELFVEQVHIAPTSPLVGKTLVQAELSSTLGVSVLACHMPEGELIMRPESTTVLSAGTELVVLGTREQLQALMKLSGHDLARAVLEPVEDIGPQPSP
jgi:voltage-gated potassium channel